MKAHHNARHRLCGINSESGFLKQELRQKDGVPRPTLSCRLRATPWSKSAEEAGNLPHSVFGLSKHPLPSKITRGPRLIHRKSLDRTLEAWQAGMVTSVCAYTLIILNSLINARG